MLLNLIENALKYGPAGQPVEVRTTHPEAVRSTRWAVHPVRTVSCSPARYSSR